MTFLRFAARLDALNALVLQRDAALLQRRLPLKIGLLSGVTAGGGDYPAPVRHVDGHLVEGQVLVRRRVVPDVAGQLRLGQAAGLDGGITAAATGISPRARGQSLLVVRVSDGVGLGKGRKVRPVVGGMVMVVVVVGSGRDVADAPLLLLLMLMLLLTARRGTNWPRPNIP